MKQFDHYEFAALLVPGCALIVGILTVYPSIYSFDELLKVSFGSLGIFIVFSYVAGQVLQSVGNLVDRLYWWLVKGRPSDWVRTRPERILSPGQLEALKSRAKDRLSLPNLDIEQLSERDWFAVTRQIYSDVSGANRAGRIDIFNSNYGLNRGLAAAGVCIAVAALVAEPVRPAVALIAVVVAVLSAYRMHRFGIHYARELFVQFLQLPPKPSGEESKK